MAIEVLDYILKLELAPARWDGLAEIVEIAIRAETAGDADGLRQAAAELELAAPVRITRIGDAPAIPAPPKVRERVNHLLHALSTADADRRTGQDDQ